MEDCPVCLAPLAQDQTTAAMPSCGHRIHAACMITCAQYDVRCPVCRTVGTDVKVRPRPAPELALPVSFSIPRHGLFGSHGIVVVNVQSVQAHEDLDVEVEVSEDAGVAEDAPSTRRAHAVRAWNRYARRRRRLFARCPELLQRFERLRELRTNVATTEKLLARTYHACCRRMWRESAEVREMRQALVRLKQRHRRQDKRLEHDLTMHIGAEPIDEDLLYLSS